MANQDRWEERYKKGDIPWDTGIPDLNLINVVIKRPIRSCKALDIGCGTGDDAVWLAQQNFSVTGIDVSEMAIQKAIDKASRAGVECTLLVRDFLKDEIPGAPFSFVYDKGCFHVFDSDEHRNNFAEKVAAYLEPTGLWLSIIGNADEQRQGPGPPQRTARDIVAAVEPFFEILSLSSGHFGSNRPNPPRAWLCLMQKRKKR